jgi:hypothetical protein
MPAGADAARLFHTHQLQTYVRVVGGDWRQDFEYAWQVPDPEPDEGPGLTWRQLTFRLWSGTWDSKTRGTVTRYGDGWVAHLRLEDPPGDLNLITSVDGDARTRCIALGSRRARLGRR